MNYESAQASTDVVGTTTTTIVYTLGNNKQIMRSTKATINSNRSVNITEHACKARSLTKHKTRRRQRGQCANVPSTVPAPRRQRANRREMTFTRIHTAEPDETSILCLHNGHHRRDGGGSANVFGCSGCLCVCEYLCVFVECVRALAVARVICA